MSIAHWGNSQITGRGLLALVGKGQVYQIDLKAGEDYVAHPSNIVAYAVTQHPPIPYRLKSSSLRFQTPSMNLSSLLPHSKFVKAMRESDTWRALTQILFTVRTWSRRTIWGDRLFLQFHGPTTILLQSRASRLSDVLTTRDVNEIADTPAGAVQSAVTLPPTSKDEGLQSSEAQKRSAESLTHLRVATVSKDGKVEFKDADDFKTFT
ncbi:Altered inheritance of mitochondria protein 24, mitochondrial [Acarospora aff. strigata]|nr:Altered inheritance of mitochondria protein 24, mitochondrial [Acarospora aff. strigata]